MKDSPRKIRRSLRRSARLCLCALIAGSTLLAGCSTGNAPLRCETQINRALAQSSIPRNEVSSIQLARSGSGRKQERNEDLNAWVRLNSCSGNIVITMTRACYVKETYGTGNCRAIAGRQ